MIDFHSHILPALDDGSKNTDESLCLLSMLSEQGIDTVIATPHFYPEEESVNEFIDRRQNSYNELIPHLKDDLPKILLGAEVTYYDGISSLEGLENLTIAGTNLLLLEMPMCTWSDYALKELNTLSCIKGLTIIIAHIERYMRYQPRRVFEQLTELGILVQVNASFFCSALTKRKALNMLLKGGINVIGSDCHNTTTRAPHIGEAFEIIKSKLGNDFIQDLAEYHRYIILGTNG